MFRHLHAALICAALLLLAAAGEGRAEMSKGQTQYVPCSSHIYHGLKTRQVDLTVTLVVRNLDTKRPFTLTSVDYHGTDGKLLRRYLSAPVVIGPIAAREFVVEEKDKEGGVGAAFLVRWTSNDEIINEPLVEAVMISSSNNLGISYINRGVVVKE